MKNQKSPSSFEIRKYARLNHIDKVIATLSGGADSIANVLLLKESQLKIKALHCNFHLRGPESDRDEKFVVDFCQKHQIPLELKHFNVYEFIECNPGISIEMACRNLRHEWFKMIKEEERYDRITTGHNADDNIETFFLNLLRGSGTSGLKGMEVDTGVIWRPLLKCHRTQILDYLKEKKQDYIVDSSNLQSDFRRNFLRNEVIPLLKSRWQGFDKALDTSLRYLATENRIVEDSVNKILNAEPNYLSEDAIMNFPDPELLVRRFISPLKPFTTTAGEIIESISAAKPHVRTWTLPLGKVILQNHKLKLQLFLK